ncbi:MAG: DHH family phosphoesterase [Deltaproteobacteria bacterium]|nr:DHH family phosphoesterase [Deltaproteobacteria bacterium]
MASGKRLVIFLHDNPDPDALAAGWILQHIGQHLGIRSQIVYSGRLGRAENRTMVKLLKIPVRCLHEKHIRYLKNDRYALVDTQPGTGNNIFPHRDLNCHIVIDHHPRQPALKANYCDIRPDVGSCTTMLLDYQQHFGIPMNSNLATAAAYAIVSETQDLDRENTKADRKAYVRLFPHVHLRALGRIRHPVHERDYYRTIARAMRHVMVSKNTCVCHVGQVHTPEVVAEFADFLVAMERINWCLVSGFHQGNMVISIRTTNARADAERVMKRILLKLGQGGGHGMIGGGAILCKDLNRYDLLAEQITKRFLKHLSRSQTTHLRPLIENDRN